MTYTQASGSGSFDPMGHHQQQTFIKSTQYSENMEFTYDNAHPQHNHFEEQSFADRLASLGENWVHSGRGRTPPSDLPQNYPFAQFEKPGITQNGFEASQVDGNSVKSLNELPTNLNSNNNNNKFAPINTSPESEQNHSLPNQQISEELTFTASQQSESSSGKTTGPWNTTVNTSTRVTNSPDTSVLSSPLTMASDSGSDVEDLDDSQVSTNRTSATTPTTPVPIRPTRPHARGRADFKPKISIPTNMHPHEYGSQCVKAAKHSRLEAYWLHQGEYELLRDHITHVQVTVYMNIRNGILRLWHQNPTECVTREKAAGCAKEYRFFDLADVCYEWLVRHGYINFGCVSVPSTLSIKQKVTVQRKKIVIIGAGVSGLAAARQLEGLFTQLGELLDPDEAIPQIVILEGRGRIGGRVYSHPIKNIKDANLEEGLRPVVDLGASIVLGCDNGNPLKVLVRQQLKLPHRKLDGKTDLYDVDGKPVNTENDIRTTKLFNLLLDKVAVHHRPKSALLNTAEGLGDLMNVGRDPESDGSKVISEMEKNYADIPPLPPTPEKSRKVIQNLVRAANGSLPKNGQKGSPPKDGSLHKMKKTGFQFHEPLSKLSEPYFKPVGKDPKHPTMGDTLIAGLKQYQQLAEITDLDMRLVNWHIANHEYSTASNIDQQSLKNWDMDDGYTFEGPHSMITGGYIRVPAALWLEPTKLDVRKKHIVTKISHRKQDEKVQVECEDGKVIEADKVVVTLPLGVLKAGTVEFDPPLPKWKTGAIERVGYGLLNKVCRSAFGSLGLWR